MNKGEFYFSVQAILAEGEWQKGFCAIWSVIRLK